MAAGRETPIGVLKRFSRLLSEASDPDAMTQLLADAGVAHVGADATAVLRVAATGDLRVVAGSRLPEPLRSFAGDADAIGPELADAMRKASGEKYPRALAIPLVGGGGLFGAFVLLFASGKALDAEHASLAEALADLAASGLAAAEQLMELRRSNAELRASREVLARTQKLRALGQMAAGVTHDLKNIINPISLHLQFLRRALPKQGADDAHQSLNEMNLVLRRGLETIERLRSFSHQSPTKEAVSTDLNHIAREAMGICRPRMREKHDVHYKLVEALGEPGPVVLVVSDAVAALVNLMVNAIEAMPEGGSITVSTGVDDAGSFVCVKDEGPGLAPEVEARIFEPFFTTKGNEGTGLGLAMVYAFVQRSRGHLSLETAPGKGAAFTLWFPAAGAPSAGTE